MNLRAVIFDVYGTLLEVGPPPADAAGRWERLWWNALQLPPRLSLDQFSAACETTIVREHLAAQDRGISHPEVYWPTVVCEVVPELAQLPTAMLDDFIFAQSQLWHTVQLPPAQTDLLRELSAKPILLGIASNAQAYTIRELQVTMARAGLSLDIFTPALCFWSFEHGFSKPDPHVFRLLSARLAALDIAPAQILMVGDRLDNDVEPARRAGWRTWHVASEVHGQESGDWRALRRRLGDRRAA